MTPAHDSTATPVLGLVLKGFPRISETFISGEILGLEREGVAVRIISLRHPREAFTHGAVQRITAPVDYLPTTLRGNLLRLAKSNLKALGRRPGPWLRGLAGALRRMARTRRLATLRHFLQGGHIVGEILPASNIAHLHAHFAHSPTSVARFAAEIAGLPFSFTAHAKDIYTQKPGRVAEKLTQARMAITCTRYNQARLLSLAPNGAEIHCVYHGIDLSLFRTPGEHAPAEPPYRLLTVARLTEKKGIDTVLRCVRILREAGLDVRHDVIGDGEDRAELEALRDELGLQDVCRFHGTMPHEKVLDFYQRAHVFALGCRIAKNGDRDGIPNVVAEALAMKVPVAATDVSGVPELVEHETTGLLCEPDSPQALARNIRRLLLEQNLRRRVTTQGRDKVEEVFDNRRLIPEIAAIFRSHGL
ncbi:MAG: glycosyltransferase [Desulfovibrionaceae bacterium]